ncbi:MAG: hypothetical protein ACLT9P_08840 [Evtepia gabavorous]
MVSKFRIKSAAYAHTQKSAGHSRLERFRLFQLSHVPNLHSPDQEQHKKHSTRNGKDRQHLVQRHLNSQFTDTGVNIEAIDEYHHHLNHCGSGQPEEHPVKRTILNLFSGTHFRRLVSSGFYLVFLHTVKTLPIPGTDLP